MATENNANSAGKCGTGTGTGNTDGAKVCDVVFKENVYSTVCPGCGFGCGVYMREIMTDVPTGSACGAPLLHVDFRKASPVNEGKLCRFGVKLAKSFCPAESMVDGNDTDVKTAVSKAAEILKKTKPENICLLSIGNATNEEHLMFMEVGKKLGVPVNTGMTGLFKAIGKLHAHTGRGVTYDDVAHAKKIYLLVDPYVSYPLLVRRLIHAKNKGAEIISFGLKEFPIADKNILLTPEMSLYDVDFKPDADTLIISDLTPYTHAKRLAEIVELSAGRGNPDLPGNMLFLRPFINATGAGYLSKHTKQKSFDDILAGIDDGSIKVLYCLESDLIDICLNDHIKEAFKNLDALIIQSSRYTSSCNEAGIVIASEPFYKKKGSVMNSEGRLINLSTAAGETLLTGFNALSDMLTVLGAKPMTFDEAHQKVLNMLGATDDEFKIQPPEKKNKPAVLKISGNLPNITTNADLSGGPEAPSSFVSSSSVKAVQVSNEVNLKHVYLMNPFLWNNMEDEDFFEISRCQVKELKLLKGFTADVMCNCGERLKTSEFKVSPMADGYIISWSKQVYAKAPVVDVTVKRSPTKPDEKIIVKECNIPQ
ncbi:hypothetical protein [Methanolapillus millepedarum]|uniref:4Fe-4S Mo/W bis-MGD-type domain-containing protein n=1 Tax=Methanolapillus millepedarum TaxID=3028296 RepID=A0AA96ZTJ7_9EURY|nr:hypothetical protein MsAc7_01410 [Methanosarcinaceae archaeon Ac7]